MLKTLPFSTKTLVVPVLLCALGVVTPLSAVAEVKAQASKPSQATPNKEPASNADSATWFAWHQSQSKQGNLKSRAILGSHYCHGAGVKKDEARGRELMQEAAQKGDAFAQVLLSDRLSNGRCGLEKDETQAVEWARKAAEQGDAEGQYYMALAYRSGLGVDKDLKQAAAWYEKSVEQGHSAAKDSLAIMYAKGEGVARDHDVALRMLRENVAQGHLFSQSLLGSMYRQGALVRGEYALTPKSSVAAYALYSAQQTANVEAVVSNIAKESRERLEKEMTPMQIRVAEQLAKKMLDSGDTLKVLDAYMAYERPWLDTRSEKLASLEKSTTSEDRRAIAKESYDAITKESKQGLANALEAITSSLRPSNERPSDELASKTFKSKAEYDMMPGMKVTDMKRDNGWLESQVPKRYRVRYNYNYELTADGSKVIIDAAENMLKEIPKEFAGDFLGLGFAQFTLNIQAWKSSQGESFDYRQMAFYANCTECVNFWEKDRPESEKKHLETVFLASWLVYSDLGFQDSAVAGDMAPRWIEMSFIEKEKGWDPMQ